MDNRKINKLRQEVNKILKQKAKEAIKNNSKLKLVILDIKHHFKQKDAWPISYSFYQENSGVHELLFNQVLLLLNMKIYFCKTRQSIVFKKESK